MVPTGLVIYRYCLKSVQENEYCPADAKIYTAKNLQQDVYTALYLVNNVGRGAITNHLSVISLFPNSMHFNSATQNTRGEEIQKTQQSKQPTINPNKQTNKTNKTYRLGVLVKAFNLSPFVEISVLQVVFFS